MSAKNLRASEQSHWTLWTACPPWLRNRAALSLSPCRTCEAVYRMHRCEWALWAYGAYGALSRMRAYRGKIPLGAWGSDRYRWLMILMMLSQPWLCDTQCWLTPSQWFVNWPWNLHCPCSRCIGIMNHVSQNLVQWNWVFELLVSRSEYPIQRGPKRSESMLSF